MFDPIITAAKAFLYGLADRPVPRGPVPAAGPTPVHETEGLAARQDKLVSSLIRFNMSLKGACAIAGNATIENECRPLTIGRKDHGSDGCLQWRAERLDALKKIEGWQTIDGQAQFCWRELHEAQYISLRRDLIRGSLSIATLTEDFCEQYERPNMSEANLKGRIKAAIEIYERHK